MDPPPPELKATRARPVTGLIPTARGAREAGLPVEGSAEGKLIKGAASFGTAGSLISMTASVAFVLLATSARFRMLSTATETGPVAVQGPGLPSVQRELTAICAAKSISVMLFEPWLVTTAMPVAVSIATEVGLVPTVIGEPSCTGAEAGCTARLTAAMREVLTLFLTLIA